MLGLCKFRCKSLLFSGKSFRYSRSNFCTTLEVQSGPTLNYGDTDVFNHIVALRDGKTLRSKYGEIPHSEIKQTPIGHYVYSNKNLPYLVSTPTLDQYVLHMKRGPTPIYPQEAASIPYLLDLCNGDKVLEAGTGSGGLTLFLSRAVGPTGQIDTYEVRQDFHEIAKANVENWKRGCNNVNFNIGNLSEMTLPQNHYDGVVLDMVAPWSVLKTIIPALKYGKCVICLIPNAVNIERKESNERQNASYVYQVVFKKVNVLQSTYQIPLKKLQGMEKEEEEEDG